MRWRSSALSAALRRWYVAVSAASASRSTGSPRFSAACFFRSLLTLARRAPTFAVRWFALRGPATLIAASTVAVVASPVSVVSELVLTTSWPAGQVPSRGLVRRGFLADEKEERKIVI